MQRRGPEKRTYLLQNHSLEKGNFDFLKDNKTCPYCQTEQAWVYSSKKSWREVLIGAIAALLGVFFLYLFFTCGAFNLSLDFAGDDSGSVLLILGGCSLTIGLCGVIEGNVELRKKGALKDQKQQRPLVRFPE